MIRFVREFLAARDQKTPADFLFACWLLFSRMAFRPKEGSFIVSVWKVGTSPSD